MKKPFYSIALLIFLMPALAACGKSYNYAAHLSEIRSDVFCAETEEFSVTVSCVSREYPYVTDGIACPKSDVIEISIVPVSVTPQDYSVYLLGGGEWGGEASFRNYAGDWFYSESVASFPEESVTLRVEWGEETRELTATSVKNADTLSVKDALGCAVKSEQPLIERLTQGGTFRGEFHVRLLRRNKNYYYVGIVDTEGHVLSLLLDAESGEVLARRETPA